MAVFGCVDKETQQFLNQKANGILGLGPDQVSNILAEMNNMHGPLSKKDETFSICFADNGGLLTVDGMSPGLARSNPTIVKYRKDSNHYSLMIDDILIGGNALNLSAETISMGPGIVIDSGATYTYFESRSYNLTTQII